MSADIVNGLLEFFGAFFIVGTIRKTYHAKTSREVWVPQVAFFTGWGFWNIYYYPSLGQWWSVAGAALICFMNAIWCGMLIYYGTKDRVR